MPKDGSKTRLKILDETTSLVFENGFSGTTIDLILERTNITKGAFFYHFKSKTDLAFQMIKHFRDNDMKMLEEGKSHVMEKKTSPRDQLLSFIQWYIDYFDTLTEPYAGCLYASFINESEQFDQEIRQIVTDAILTWRAELTIMIDKAKEGSGSAIDSNSLADMFTVVLEGAFVTSKALNEPELTAIQLRHYKKYLELLF